METRKGILCQKHACILTCAMVTSGVAAAWQHTEILSEPNPPNNYNPLAYTHSSSLPRLKLARHQFEGHFYHQGIHLGRRYSINLECNKNSCQYALQLAGKARLVAISRLNIESNLLVFKWLSGNKKILPKSPIIVSAVTEKAFHVIAGNSTLEFSNIYALEALNREQPHAED